MASVTREIMMSALRVMTYIQHAELSHAAGLTVLAGGCSYRGCRDHFRVPDDVVENEHVNDGGLSTYMHRPRHFKGCTEGSCYQFFPKPLVDGSQTRRLCDDR
jgi:hypothetical protein